MSFLLTIQWAEIADDARINNAAKSLISHAEAASKAMGTYNPYLYLNYAAYFQDPISGYGSASQLKLERVSKKFDPGQLFQKQLPRGFISFSNSLRARLTGRTVYNFREFCIYSARESLHRLLNI